jgi:trigger factor
VKGEGDELLRDGRILHSLAVGVYRVMVNVTVEELPGCKRALVVEVPPETIHPTVEEVYRKLGRRVSVAGFRRGKVPREILEHRFKEEVREEVLQELIPSTYRQALEKSHLAPVGRPTVEEVSFQLGEPLRYKAVVEVKPELEVKEHTGVVVSRKKIEVTDEEVEKQLQALQEQTAEYLPMEGWPALREDRLIVDAQGLIDGKPRKDLRVENFALELGAGQFLPGVDERLVGVRKGEIREVPVTFPPEHPRKDLRGREVLFRFTVKEIKKKKIPPLDDTFAKTVGECATLQELRDKIRQELLKGREREDEQRLKWEVVEKIAAAHPFELPESLVQAEMEAMLQEISRSVGARPDRFEGDVSFRLKLEEAARRRVRHTLILEVIARQEKIEATPEEVEAEIQTLATALGQKPEDLRGYLEREGSIARLEANLRERKTLNFLFTQAKILDNYGLITLP